MSSPDHASLETLSLAELRELVGTLLAKVAELGSVIAALKAENQALRDEVARLKGLPPRPPSRPSGMEKATGGSAGPGEGGKRSRRWRGAKRDRDAVSAEVVVKAIGAARQALPRQKCRGLIEECCDQLRLRTEVFAFEVRIWASGMRIRANVDRAETGL